MGIKMINQIGKAKNAVTEILDTKMTLMIANMATTGTEGMVMIKEMTGKIGQTKGTMTDLTKKSGSGIRARIQGIRCYHWCLAL